MRFTTVFALALAAARALAADPAPVSEDNPVGTTYKAELPQLNGSSITGYASATGNTNGTGTVWSINFANFGAFKGPFVYHVHALPVPADGNCTGAGPHLDPQNRTEQPLCDPSQGLDSCQVGDLAGKHGKITSDPFQVFYLDRYTSTIPGTAAFVGNRSIVIHDVNLNRIACANITMLAFASEPNVNATGTGTAAPACTNAPSSAATATTSGTAPVKQSAATTSVTPAKGAAIGRPNSGAAAAVAVGLAGVAALL